MWSTIIELTLVLFFGGLFLAFWPNAGDLPLPQGFLELIVALAQKWKMAIELPILERVWSWMWFYLQFFFLYYGFRISIIILRMFAGKDKLPNAKIK